MTALGPWSGRYRSSQACDVVVVTLPPSLRGSDVAAWRSSIWHARRKRRRRYAESLDAIRLSDGDVERTVDLARQPIG
jgi:hypothetical protein